VSDNLPLENDHEADQEKDVVPSKNSGKVRSSRNLTAKQAKFIASYQLTHNGTEAARNAGYPEKSCPSIAWQLLKNPKIRRELDEWKAKKASEITKDDFIDLALKDYKQLDVNEPNKPRFLDIAGKALGHLGNNSDRPNQTVNNITLNKIEVNAMPTGKKWDALRQMLEAE